MMPDFIIEASVESLKITVLVFFMMVLVDFLNVGAKGKLAQFTGTTGLKQYTLTNLLGATPGCLGSYTNVSFYMHGMISFGALSGSMIATAGDEAFVMIAQLGWIAPGTFLLLFVLGIIGSYISDAIVKKYNLQVCTNCHMQEYHEPHERKRGHFLFEHLYKHIIRKHLVRVFLWTFVALLSIHAIQHFWDLNTLHVNYLPMIILLAALIGLLPDSGPHLIFVTLFAQGVVPFSVLLTSSIVQDGHGLLPLFSFSLKDSMYVKAFNLLFGLVVGYLVFFLGY